MKKHTFTIETDFAIGDSVWLKHYNEEFDKSGTIVRIVIDGSQIKYDVHGSGIESNPFLAEELELTAKQ